MDLFLDKEPFATTYDQNIYICILALIFLYVIYSFYGVFRKLQQPSVSPAAPHPGQALLRAAECIYNKNKRDKKYDRKKSDDENLNRYGVFRKLHQPSWEPLYGEIIIRKVYVVVRKRPQGTF